MTILCLGASLAGLAAASLIPFLPFACAVLAAIVLGAAWVLVAGGAAGQTALSALALLFACQIGYGAGVILVALVGQGMAGRRLGGDKPASPPARPLRTGNGPR